MGTLLRKPVYTEAQQTIRAAILKAYDAGGLPAVDAVNRIVQQASDAASYQSSVVTQATSALQNATGVNLDTELENMMTLQQAYSAGARLLSVAQQAYTDLYNAVSSGG